MKTRRFSRPVLLGAAFVVGVGSLSPAAAPPASGTPKQATLAPKAKFTALEVLPSTLKLTSIRDSRRLVVTATDEHGLHRDVTQEARLTATSPHIAIDSDGFVVPKSKGDAEIVVSAAGLKTTVHVHVTDASAQPVDFVREVIPILGKIGCNQGTCHGSQAGRAGFKLSLRGYDPLFDYRALVDDVSGRRFNRALPAQSLMLLKPTQGVPHEGGFLFSEDSRDYKVLYQWIAEGCVYKETSRVTQLEVLPSAPVLQNAKDTQQLVVIAHFPDGTSRDVTRDAICDTSNFEVATVSSTGQVEAVRRGEAAALVRYEGQYAVAPITVIGTRDGYVWKESPEFNFVDAHVDAKLKKMKLWASDLCSDAEFLRRISLDLTGVPPDIDQTRAFVADSRDSRSKRREKTAELLSSSAFVDHWTLKWSDLLLNKRKYVQEKGVWAFRNWIRQALTENKPYDKFVYELMTASGRSLENPAANYYRIAREPNIVMENMTQVFLGIRFNCNRCHDHPFERWTQQQYYELSAYFSAVGRAPGATTDDEIVYTLPAPDAVINPRTNTAVKAVFPFTYSSMKVSGDDRRIELAQWLTAKDNPYFAKSLVNRYWSYFLGRGIIDPVDDIRAGNPPSNSELLDALTADFIEHGFDLKHLVLTITASYTYQRSYRSNAWNTDDAVNFSHAYPRRLTAEELFDATMVATGSPFEIPGAPPGFRAAQLPDPQIDVSFLDMFGRAPRESPCECERTSAVSLGQTLNLINGPTIANAIANPRGLIARRVAAGAKPKDLVQDVYLSVLCRYPTPDETKRANAYMAEVKNPSDAAQDLMWALINSPAFLFNR
ncbi:MAG TPA: DUF1549 domain-containing protein [Planctomycetaceae bacterium]|jgi:hypothetical protein|nr:DUF1549 domain-containing protein [Planctomycetaceae bacterium]